MALCLLLAWAPQAHAAAASLAVTTTVRDEQDCSSGKSCAPTRVRDYTATLRLNAEPGERNDVTVEFAGAFDAVTIKDASAPLKALGGCAQVAPSTVRCHPGTPPPDGLRGSARRIVNVSLGDRDDRLSTAGPEPPVGYIGSLAASSQLNVLAQDGADVVSVFGGESGVVEGGPGNDAITASFAAGGDGNDILTGGASSDVLDGGAGNDRLASGEGDDDLVPGTGLDSIDGGPGADRASWEQSPVPVVVDLRAGTASAPGSDTDIMSAIEHATGSPGADRITGTDDRNIIYGLGGDDAISAAGGDDEIEAGPGTDRVLGGAGNDELQGRGGRDWLSADAGNDSLFGESGPQTLRGGSGKDEINGGGGRDRIFGEGGNDRVADAGRARVSCGGGRDMVGEPSPRAVLRRDCELVDLFGFGDGLAPPRLTRAGARLRLGNLCQVAGGRCRITVALSAGKRGLGRRRITIRHDRARTLVIRLSPRERALVRRRPIRVAVRTLDSDGDRLSGSFTARVPRPSCNRCGSTTIRGRHTGCDGALRPVLLPASRVDRWACAGAPS